MAWCLAVYNFLAAASISLLQFIRTGPLQSISLVKSKTSPGISLIVNPAQLEKKRPWFFWLLRVYHIIDNGIWQLGQIIYWYTPIIIRRISNALEPVRETAQSFASTTTRRLVRIFRPTPSLQIPVAVKCDWDSFYDSKLDHQRAWMVYNCPSGTPTPAKRAVSAYSQVDPTFDVYPTSTPPESEILLPSSSLPLTSVGESTLISSCDSFLDSPSVYSSPPSSLSTSIFAGNDDVGLESNHWKDTDRLDIPDLKTCQTDIVSVQRTIFGDKMTPDEDGESPDEMDVTDTKFCDALMMPDEKSILSHITEDSAEFWSSSRSSMYTFTELPFSPEYTESDATIECFPSPQLEPVIISSLCISSDTRASLPAILDTNLHQFIGQDNLPLAGEFPGFSDDLVPSSNSLSLAPTPCDELTSTQVLGEAICDSGTSTRLSFNKPSSKVHRSARIMTSTAGLAIAMDTGESRNVSQKDSNIWKILALPAKACADLQDCTVALESLRRTSTPSHHLPGPESHIPGVAQRNPDLSEDSSNGLDLVASLEPTDTLALNDDRCNALDFYKPAKMHDIRLGIHGDLPGQRSSRATWDEVLPRRPNDSDSHSASRRVGLHGRHPRQRFAKMPMPLLLERESLTLEARHRSIIQERHQSPTQSAHITGLRNLVLPTRVAVNDVSLLGGPPPAPRGVVPAYF